MLTHGIARKTIHVLCHASSFHGFIKVTGLTFIIYVIIITSKETGGLSPAVCTMVGARLRFMGPKLMGIFIFQCYKSGSKQLWDFTIDFTPTEIITSVLFRQTWKKKYFFFQSFPY